MTLQHQDKTNVLPFSDKNSAKRADECDIGASIHNHNANKMAKNIAAYKAAHKRHIQAPRKINPAWTVERLFGKHHWASKWVIGLCESDPQLLLHLIDQSPDYVHFICLVRLALLERSLSEENQLAYAELIRTQSRKKIIQKLYPSAPKAILSVLPKLQKTPLSQEYYRQLAWILADRTMCKYLHHAKHVRKLDIDMLGMLKNIPREFQVKGIVNCIEDLGDYKHLLQVIKIAQMLNLAITRQEAETATRNMDSMYQIVEWLKKKIEMLPFPAVPWQGNEWIKPLRSKSEMQDVADRFQNCVMSYVARVIIGYSYFYVCERPPAVIEVKRDVVFGWTVDEMEGACSQKIPDVQKREIRQVFVDAGFLPIEINEIDHNIFE